MPDDLNAPQGKDSNGLDFDSNSIESDHQATISNVYHCADKSQETDKSPSNNGTVGSLATSSDSVEVAVAVAQTEAEDQSSYKFYISHVNTNSSLDTYWYNHLASYGFTPTDILWLEKDVVFLVNGAAAKKLGYHKVVDNHMETPNGYKESIGLYYRLNGEFGQLRPRYQLKSGQKYLCRAGIAVKPWIPPSGQFEYIGEGPTDTFMGYLRLGLKISAATGFNAVPRLYEKGCGAKLVPDRDFWTNSGVAIAAYKGAKWTKGKIVLPPFPTKGHEKDGLSEFCQGLSPEEAREAFNKLEQVKPEEAWYRLAAYLPSIESVRDRLHMALALVGHAAKTFSDTRDIPTFNREVYTKGGYKGKERAVLEKWSDQMLAYRERQSRKKAAKAAREVAAVPKPILKADSELRRQAIALLDSGKLLDTIVGLAQAAGVVRLDERIRLLLAGSLGTLRGDIKRSLAEALVGSSGLGKSLLLDLLEQLLPEGTWIRVSSISDAVLKRVGDTWASKIILVDELSSWADSSVVLSTLKELLTRGSADFVVAESDGQNWKNTNYHVKGPIGLCAGATDATLSHVLGFQEEEIRSRLNEIPVPEDAEYIQEAAAAVFRGLEPKKLEEVDPELVAVIREAIAVAVERPIPKAEHGFEEVLPSLVRAKNPLILRLLKRLKILLENTALLLGRSEVGLDTYEELYPLISKLFRRSLSADNDATLANLVRLAEWLRSNGTIQKPFTINQLREALGCGKTKAYDVRDDLDGNEWIVKQMHGNGGYQITPEGLKKLEGIRKDAIILPDILPAPARMREELDKFRTLNPMPSKDSSEQIPQDSAQIPQPRLTRKPLYIRDREIEAVYGSDSVRYGWKKQN